MEREELAARLVAADDAERAALLHDHAALADLALASMLKERCLQAWSSDPAHTRNAANALAHIADMTSDAEIRALAAWTAGVAALTEPRLEAAIVHLDDAAARFAALGKPHDAASTQVSKLIALAMLGRYDEAITTGEQARDVFVAHGDTLAAGKIEQNLGNIYFRRDDFSQAELLFRAARGRFSAVGEQSELARAENNLANVLSRQHQFRDAALLFEQALARAEAVELRTIQASTECNIGALALYGGQYDRALDYLERSRRNYTALGMQYRVAKTEHDLAETYLELNLVPEAVEIYTRIAAVFAGLGLRTERARTLAQFGRALLLLRRFDEARGTLTEAAHLFFEDGNAVGGAVVRLTEAQLHYAEEEYDAAAQVAAQTEATFAAAGVPGWLLLAQWVRGEALRASGQGEEARRVLLAARRDAEVQEAPQIMQMCRTSLGLLAETQGDYVAAKTDFVAAVNLIEAMRAPLPAEEFRVAFVADKLTPYAKLVQLSLADPDTDDTSRVTEALRYVERARSRVLVETLRGDLRAHPEPRDPFEAELLAKLDALREELNWYYNQIHREPESGSRRGVTVMAELHAAMRERETQVLAITRQLQQRGESTVVQGEPVALADLQRDLGADTALVEYFALDGRFLAFVVTAEGVTVCRDLGTEDEVQAALAQVRFQMETLRFGAERVRGHLDQLAARARHHLTALYDLLLRPIEPSLGARRLVVVPHRSLHYVPFHALHDGAGYVIERREVSYAPSATVLHHCLGQRRVSPRRAVLLGVPDAQIPRVRDEVAAIAPLFPDAEILLDEQVTLVALREHAPTADVLHLACHGQFRPDNPLFSSLRLADSWLTVRDTYGLRAPGCLVVLSACETGISAVAPGDELIGLARGFFSAGAPTLLVSLWTVDDASTAELMTTFYTHLLAGETPAAALRHAQRSALAQHTHPFFWSPFIILGRW